ncbi:MAG: flagellar hook assembly protein FlgD [Treponema sp.]|uniref:flagellar hook assembly protein FlgD n=1 Tax=Treponema sp. TaxID=166 RepID=UPI00298E5115|nr:flagellar hook assembly protein FlgD [Treponema sp.]MDD5811952.1 flagellar hook assembly protein FlgD [Treponema sp.]
MDFNPTMSAADRLQTEMAVDRMNKQLAVNGRKASQELGKDDFLKLLLTQLSHQDPTSPMDNNEFIAQMAQFSSLEQINNMSTSFSKMSALLNSSDAVNTIGKEVEINAGDTTVRGVVQAATRGANPQVQVNGMLYDMEKINAVYGN